MPHDDDSPWENIQVANRCKNEWRQMRGNSQVRVCRECKQNVYDISTMSPQEADHLILGRERHVFTRLYRRHDGTFMVKDCPSGALPSFEEIQMRWFGPSRKRLWKQFCAQIGAEYIDGGKWKEDKVKVRHAEWTITLDSYTIGGARSSRYTRIRAPFVNSSQFRFTIYRRDLSAQIGEALGIRDVQIGDEQFDRDFVIAGNDEQKLRELFANDRLRQLVGAQESILLRVKDNEGWFGPEFPRGVDELYFEVRGVIMEIRRLNLLVQLFIEVLDQLFSIGCAYNDDPGVEL